VRALLIVLRRFFAAVWRHRWAYAVPVATLLLPATIWAVRLADVYEARTVVQVQPLRPENIGGALPQETTSRPEGILGTVRDRLFARENLQAAAPILTDEPVRGPEALEALSKAFAWELVGALSFEVTCRNEDPQRAADAVNLLVESWLEQERADRRRRAESNREFHEAELEKARAAHREALVALDAFRADHLDSLPERKEAIYAELRRLQAEISTQEGMAAAARTRVQALDDQLVLLEAEQPTTDAARVASAGEQALRFQLETAQRALSAAEAELAELRRRYTEAHPDVVRLRGAVEVHRGAVADTVRALQEAQEASLGTANQTAEAALERRRRGLVALRDGARATADRAATAADDARAGIGRLNDALARIPATEAGLRPLERDLEDAASILEARRRHAADARAASEFYARNDPSDVTGFRVDAWAVAPVEPSGPGRWRFLATALVLGLLVGYGLVVLGRHVEGATISTPEDLTDLFPAAEIVRVPLLAPVRRASMMRYLREAGLTLYVLLLVGSSVLFLAAHKGWIDAPGWVRDVIGRSA
jgi:uncharacterized protein involved in exopolysaccharide biosynthesis